MKMLRGAWKLPGLWYLALLGDVYLDNLLSSSNVIQAHGIFGLAPFWRMYVDLPLEHVGGAALRGGVNFLFIMSMIADLLIVPLFLVRKIAKLRLRPLQSNR